MIYRSEAYYNALYQGTENEGKFWVYNAEAQNCQAFVFTVLKANGMMNKQLEEYIIQDAEGMLKDRFDLVKPVAKGVTNLGGIADVILYGL